eukprot:m.910372 g.910372  ORF g.910372 m.910372 type:complete len:83 (+) comp60109_c0_seq28:2698-2946(+)
MGESEQELDMGYLLCRNHGQDLSFPVARRLATEFLQNLCEEESKQYPLLVLGLLVEMFASAPREIEQVVDKHSKRANPEKIV